MVLFPDTRQAVVVLINANSELPINQVNAVLSRLPIGVVNLLRGERPPQGPSLRRAYLPFNAATALAVITIAALAWWATCTRRAWAAGLMAIAATGIVVALYVTGLSAKMLATFAPDLALVLAALAALLCPPIVLRGGRWARRSLFRGDIP
jgi:hypothetical protein